MRRFARCFAVVALFPSLVQPALADGNCKRPREWTASSGGERAYVGLPMNGRVLLEHTAQGADQGEAQIATFATSFPVERGAVYRLRTTIAAERVGREVRVRAEGASTHPGGAPLTRTLQREGRAVIDARIRANDARVRVSVDVIGNNKMWGYVGPTTLCKVAS